jgi:hypothetical protein
MPARRSAIRQQLVLLEQRLGVGDAATLSQLRSELRAYWVSMDPILSWSPQEKAALSQVFLRRQVLPRREAVVCSATIKSPGRNNCRQCEEIVDAGHLPHKPHFFMGFRGPKSHPNKRQKPIACPTSCAAKWNWGRPPRPAPMKIRLAKCSG